MNDKELINEILAGNKDIYKHLVEKYQERVFRVCMGFVHNKEDTDDITQEVFINAFLSLHTFKWKSEFSTWLQRITINACLNHLRKYENTSFILKLTHRKNREKLTELPENMKDNTETDQYLIEKQTSQQNDEMIIHRIENSFS